MYLLQTVLLTFAALFLLQLAYLCSVNKVNLGCFELFGLFAEVDLVCPCSIYPRSGVGSLVMN